MAASRDSLGEDVTVTERRAVRRGSTLAVDAAHNFLLASDRATLNFLRAVLQRAIPHSGSTLKTVLDKQILRLARKTNEGKTIPVHKKIPGLRLEVLHPSVEDLPAPHFIKSIDVSVWHDGLFMFSEDNAYHPEVLKQYPHIFEIKADICLDVVLSDEPFTFALKCDSCSQAPLTQLRLKSFKTK